MQRLHYLAAAFALLCIAHTSGSRSALQIKPQEEPEPVEAQPRTDMAFVLSAPAATLAPDQLTLTGVSSTAQFITDDKKSGVVRTGTFANGSAGALFVFPSGDWLGKPVGVLHAVSAGNATSALLQLSDPRYVPATRTLTFKARPPAASALSRIVPMEPGKAAPMANGVAARLLEDARAGIEARPLEAPPANGAQLTDAALVIDQSTQALGAKAQAKWLWWWGAPYYGFYHGPYYWGYWG